MVWPTLEELSDFIESEKNIMITLVVIAIGFYCTITPDIVQKYADQWVTLAIAFGSFYVGHRIEANRK